ncbi:hypothetical protein PQR53_01460 [Paraburkholderia fungorum]|uniref:hypothetical protein n=1 Tax=Paraburkholderia fungorum TaxID=134537 RepID=UPI0038B9843B
MKNVERFGVERIGMVPAFAFHDGGKAADSILLFLLMLDQKTRAALLDGQPDGAAQNQIDAVSRFQFGERCGKVVRFGALNHFDTSNHRAKIPIARQIVAHAPTRVVDWRAYDEFLGIHCVDIVSPGHAGRVQRLRHEPFIEKAGAPRIGAGGFAGDPCLQFLAHGWRA